MAQKKTTRYTQWVPYRRFYTIWFVKKSLTTSKHCCIPITVYDVSPLLSLYCTGTTTKAFLIQCCVYLICSSVSFAIQNLCRLFFIIFFIEIVTLFGAMLSLSCSTFHSVHYVLQKKTHRIIFVAAALPFPLSMTFGSITKDGIFMHLRSSLLLVFFLFFLSYKCLSLHLTLHRTLFAFSNSYFSFSLHLSHTIRICSFSTLHGIKNTAHYVWVSLETFEKLSMFLNPELLIDYFSILLLWKFFESIQHSTFTTKPQFMLETCLSLSCNLLISLWSIKIPIPFTCLINCFEI